MKTYGIAVIGICFALAGCAATAERNMARIDNACAGKGEACRQEMRSLIAQDDLRRHRAALAFQQGMQRTSEAYSRAARQPAYTPPRVITCQNLGGGIVQCR